MHVDGVGVPAGRRFLQDPRMGKNEHVESKLATIAPFQIFTVGNKAGKAPGLACVPGGGGACGCAGTGSCGGAPGGRACKRSRTPRRGGAVPPQCWPTSAPRAATTPVCQGTHASRSWAGGQFLHSGDAVGMCRPIRLTLGGPIDRCMRANEVLDRCRHALSSCYIRGVERQVTNLSSPKHIHVHTQRHRTASEHQR